MGKGMKAGKRPKAPGAGNMQKQMQQMQQMQRKMDELQAEINEMEATATSGGGAVTVTVSGKKEIKDIQISWNFSISILMNAKSSVPKIFSIFLVL